MKQHIGFVMQFAALTFLPGLIIFQLQFGIPLIVMPVCLLAGIVVFSIGHRLREG